MHLAFRTTQRTPRASRERAAPGDKVERSIEALLRQADAARPGEPAVLPRARLAVMARSFAGRAAAVEAALFCQLLALAGTGIDQVYVLDESPDDRALGQRLLQAAANRSFARLHVHYEPLPPA